MGVLTVKNWRKFQHYSHRNPPWIRLYCDLDRDQDFMALSEAEKWHLMACWMEASRDPSMLGEFSDDESEFKWKWRINSKTSVFDPLIVRGFLVRKHDASTALASCKQHASPETETETDHKLHAPLAAPEENKKTTKKLLSMKCAEFYALYPRKKKPRDAEKAWSQMVLDESTAKIVLSALKAQLATAMAGKELQHIPYPATWLRARSWEDEIEPVGAVYGGSDGVRRAAEDTEGTPEFRKKWANSELPWDGK